LAPDAIQMFSFGRKRGSPLTTTTTTSSAASSKELYQTNALFQRHARSVIKMLDTALSMLGPDLEPLKAALRNLGSRHVDYGVLPAHYDIVGTALLATLKAALPENKKWTHQVQHGWTTVYHIVSTHMMEGAYQRMELEQQVRQQQEQVEQHEKLVATVTAYAKPPRPTAAVASMDIHHVQVTWNWIKQHIPNYADAVGVLLFRRIFQVAPGALQLFSFAGGWSDGKDETTTSSSSSSSTTIEVLLKHPLFLRHARGVISMLDTAIGLLVGGNMEPLVQALKELGARHVEYGVLPAHYPIVGDALLFTLETALGKDDYQWNNHVKAGWVRIFGAVSTGMLTGAHERIQQEQKARNAQKEKELQQQATISAYQEVVPLPPGVAPTTTTATTTPNNEVVVGINLVKETWDFIKQEIPNYAEVAGGILFRK
jgi:hemoglobin-like flavoprotein